MIQVDYKELYHMIKTLYVQAGTPEDEACKATEIMLQADQRGVHSHGIAAIGRYIGLIEKGEMLKKEHHTVEKNFGAIEVWDGERSNGMVSAYKAMEKAMEKADEFGVGVVAVRHANHLGAGAYYSKMAEEKGMIGLMVSTGGPTMAPWGGAEKAIGNNPLSMSVPARDHYPLTLDMAQSVVAYGRVMNMKLQGEKTIPAGWGLDREGMPTTDIDKFYSVMPTGAYKGFGCSLMIDVMAGLLINGGAGFNADDDKDGAAFMMMAFKVDAFTDQEAFLQRVDNRIDELKAVKLAKNAKAIYMPGELEEIRAAASKEKVEVLEENLDDANRLAEKHGIAPCSK